MFSLGRKIRSLTVLCILLQGCFASNASQDRRNSRLKNGSVLNTCDLLPLPLDGAKVFQKSANVQNSNELTYLAAGATGVVYRDADSKFVYKFPYKTDDISDDLLEQQSDEIQNMVQRALYSYQHEVDLFIDFSPNKSHVAANKLKSYLAKTSLIEVYYNDELLRGMKKEYVGGTPLAKIDFENLSKTDPLYTLTKELYDVFKKAVLDEGYDITDLHGNNIFYTKGSNRPLIIIDGDFRGRIENLQDEDVKAVHTFQFRQFCNQQAWCRLHNF